jgi:hypothetical protein
VAEGLQVVGVIDGPADGPADVVDLGGRRAAGAAAAPVAGEDRLA